jgi:hypothetical protein
MDADGWKATKWGTESTHRRGDRGIARLASQQYGVVSLSQLRSFGLSPTAVRSRVAAGRLHPLHAGVYLVGHTHIVIEARWMAAVLACGAGALLSHRSAAAHLGLIQGDAQRTDVISPERRGRRPGIAVHRDDSLSETDRTTSRGIPCTSVARTLLDIAAIVGVETLGAACREAEVLRLFDLNAVEDVLRRNPGRRGIRRLRAVLGDLQEPGLTRSELEMLFLDLCREAGIPTPSVNRLIVVDGGMLEVDFCWERERLIVEADGRRFHATGSAFERDRRRDQLLALAGWRVIRVTWLQVTREREVLAVTIRGLLTA